MNGVDPMMVKHHAHLQDLARTKEFPAKQHFTRYLDETNKGITLVNANQESRESRIPTLRNLRRCPSRPLRTVHGSPVGAWVLLVSFEASLILLFP